MSPAEEREYLKEQINRLQASLRLPYNDEEWSPIVGQMRRLRDRLERSYISRPRWWVRKLRCFFQSVYSRLRPLDLEQLLAGPIEPLGPGALMCSLAPKIGKSNLERIELTAANFAEWVDEATRSRPGFDAGRCFRAVIADLYPGYGQVGDGQAHCRYFIEATDRDHILVSGIVRWTPVTTPTAA